MRDRALLLFAWASGGRRRWEVTGAVLEQLIVSDATTYLYRLLHTKTDQTGVNAHIERPIGVALEALTTGLKVSGVLDGALFHRIRGSRVAEPLEPQASQSVGRPLPC